MASDGLLTVSLNGREREVRAGSSLADLVATVASEARAIAVEVNGEIVPRRLLGETPLSAGDRVEIVQFVQGG